ncbi:MAG: CHASE2 domain-containing protein, partial [Desulfobulbaceae bacterium]|nr:CHASE2 domain-containing protein [Desulfobulbaceae bacterium]
MSDSESEASSSSIRPLLLPLWDGGGLLIAAGFLLTLCMFSLLAVSPVWIRQAELRLYDHMLSDRPSSSRHDATVIVGIDEESLAAYGQWPWPRYRVARLLERIHQLGAEVIALDVLMPEADRTSPDVIMAERQRDFGVVGAAGPSGATPDSNSQALAAALKKGPAIIGCYFDFSEKSSYQETGSPNVPAKLVVVGRVGEGVWPEPTGVLRSIPALTAVAVEGFTNIRHDIDGILRRAPILIRQGSH